MSNSRALTMLALLTISLVISTAVPVPQTWASGPAYALGDRQFDDAVLQGVGVQILETADPQIRDGSNGYSGVFIGLAEPSCQNKQALLQTGWSKVGPGGQPRVFFVWRVPGDQDYVRWHHYSEPGTGHRYMINSIDGSDTFVAHYDVGYWAETNPPLGVWTLSCVYSGGQASSTQNAIGVSGLWDNAYRHYQTPYFSGWNYTSTVITPGYFLVDLRIYSWQVYGNN